MQFVSTSQSPFKSTLNNFPYNLISINSSDGKGTNSSFTVTLDYPITPSIVGLSYFSVPNTIFNFGYDDIILEEQGFPPVNVNVTPGIYEVSLSSFNPIGPALAAALTAASPSGNTYTVTVDTLTAKFVFTASTTPFKFNDIDPKNNYTYYHLGFNSTYPLDVPQVFSLTQTSSGQFNLLPIRNNVYISIKEFYNRNASCNYNPYTYVVPSLAISRQSAGFAMGNKFQQFYNNVTRSTYKTLTIELKDDRGQLLKFSGEVNLILFYGETM